MNENKPNIVTEDRANLITKSESSASQIDILKEENKQLISKIEKLEISNRHIIKLNEELTDENNRLIEKLNPFVKCNNGYCENDGIGLHFCPFKSEIHDDQSLCNCCKECEEQCCQDI